jgi:hypothetical protein
MVATEAYEESPNTTETWVFLGDTSKTSPPLHCVKFEHVAMDLALESPYSLNIRHVEQGILEKPKKEKVSGEI